MLTTIKFIRFNHARFGHNIRVEVEFFYVLLWHGQLVDETMPNGGKMNAFMR